MNGILDRLRAWFATAMVGRYGSDQLNYGLLTASIVCLCLSMFGLQALNALATIFLLMMIMRMFSRNHEAREAENKKYLSITEKPRKWWRRLNERWANRKTTAYIKCPCCGKTFTLPKGKGKIRATCPHCHEQSVHVV